MTDKIEEIVADHSEFLQQSPSNRCEVFVFEPANIEEEKLGTLYIVGQIDKPRKKNLHFLNLLASVIKREYFGHKKNNPSQALEYALRQANVAIAEILGDEEDDDWLKNFHIVIAVCREKILYFAKTGKGKIYLLRDEQLNEVSKRLDVGEPPSPIKTFTNLANGALEEGDKIIFSSPAISDLSSQTVLKKIFSQEKEEMQKLLREILSYLPEKIALAAIILELRKESIAVNQNASYREMTETPLLKESGRAPEASLEQFLEIEGNLRKKIAETKKPPAFNAINSGIFNAKRTAQEIILAIIRLGKIIFNGSRKFLRRGREYLKNAVAPIGSSVSTAGAGLTRKIARDGKPTFVAIIKNPAVFISIIFLLLAGLAFIDGKEKTRDRERYQTLMDEARRQQEAARASLLYGETAQASEMMEAAQKIILEAQILGNKSDKLESEKTLAAITEEWEKLNGVVRLAEWETVLDASALSLLAKPAAAIAIDKEIYLLPKNSNLIYNYNLETKEEKFRFVNLEESFSLNAASSLLESLVLLSSKPSIAVYDLQNSLIREYDLPGVSQPVGLDSYANRLYLMDKETGYIFRVGLADESLIVGRWSKKSVTGTAVDLAVDGNVNILTSDGEIIVMNLGQEKEILRPQIRPPLLNPVKLETRDSLNNFYILDSLKERLVIISKEGRMIKQIKSNIFSAARDIFIINDSEALILTNDKLLKISF